MGNCGSSTYIMGNGGEISPNHSRLEPLNLGGARLSAIATRRPITPCAPSLIRFRQNGVRCSGVACPSRAQFDASRVEHSHALERIAAISPMPTDGGSFPLSSGERAGVRAVVPVAAIPFRTPRSALRIPRFMGRGRKTTVHKLTHYKHRGTETVHSRSNCRNPACKKPNAYAMPACHGAAQLICGAWSGMMTPVKFFFPKSAAPAARPLRHRR